MPVKKQVKQPPKKAAKKQTGAKSKAPAKPKKERDFDNVSCSFCGKKPSKQHTLIGGPDGGSICSECIGVCLQILGEHQNINVCPLTSPRTSQALEVVGSELQESPAFRIRMKYDVLYLSPKNPTSEKIYNLVMPIAEKHKIKIKNLKEITDSKLSFDKEILDIYNAFFVIADITDKDPTIMYFLGMLHLMGKPMIILAPKPEDIPQSLSKNFYVPCKGDPKTIEEVTRHFQSVFLAVKKLKKLTKGKTRRK